MDHPDTHPFLLLDVEGGAMTLRNRQGIDVVQVRSMMQLYDIISSLRKNVVEGKMYYKSVGLDSLTELQKLDMRDVMKQAKKDARDPSKIDELVPSPREWGKSGERMRLAIRALKDLDCHFFATAFISETLRENKTEGTTKVIKIHPSVPGKLKSELPGFFDIVGLLRAVNKGQGGEANVVRTLQTMQTDLVIAKDRSDVLPGLIEAPSIPVMWDLIHSDSNSNSK